MQIKSLRLKSYRSWKVDDTPVSDLAKERFKKLSHFWELREQKCSEQLIYEVLQTSRATIYRWQQAFKKRGMVGLEPGSKTPHNKRTPQWSKHLEQRVLHLRKKYPLWGKKTLTTLINRTSNEPVTESTVGRIIKKLIELNRVKPVCFFYGKLKPKKRRNFSGHAKRWTKGMKAKKPGELLQIDHMTITIDSQFTIKEFKAKCPVTKITIAQCYWNASSKTATEFLSYVQKHLPFKIHSIQVDGGSEFRADFEDLCKNEGIPLLVLPPSSPELNGDVERANRTFKREFYQLYDGLLTINHLREALYGYLQEYNTVRPHQSLAQMTPMEYYLNNFGGAESHMI